MKCTDTRGIHNITRKKPLHSLVSNFTGKEKMILQNQMVAMAEEQPLSVVATVETTEEIIGTTGTNVNVTNGNHEVPKNIYELSFRDVNE